LWTYALYWWWRSHKRDVANADLVRAVETSDCDGMWLALSDGADPNRCVDRVGRSLLLAALSREVPCVKIVERLLIRGARFRVGGDEAHADAVGVFVIASGASYSLRWSAIESSVVSALLWWGASPDAFYAPREARASLVAMRVSMDAIVVELVNVEFGLFLPVGGLKNQCQHVTTVQTRKRTETGVYFFGSPEGERSTA
jgi:hypothetical protein